MYIASAQKVSLNQTLIEQNKGDVIFVGSLNIRIEDQEGRAKRAREGFYIIDRKNGVWRECSIEYAEQTHPKDIAWHQIIYLTGLAAVIINDNKAGLLVLKTGHPDIVKHPDMPTFIAVDFWDPFYAERRLWDAVSYAGRKIRVALESRASEVPLRKNLQS
jgi:hypothetical protein